VISIKQRVLDGLRRGTLGWWVEAVASKYDRLRSPNFLVIGLQVFDRYTRTAIQTAIRTHFEDASITWHTGFFQEWPPDGPDSYSRLAARHDITMQAVQQDPTLIRVVANRFGPLPSDALRVIEF
jgi:hypothetical protein